MKKIRSWILTLLSTGVFTVLAIVLWPYAFTVVPIEEVEEMKQSEAFDQVAYVDAIWESQILPTIIENAVDLSLVLTEIDTDERGYVAKDQLIGVTNEYGLNTVGEAHVYKVMGRGQVVSVDTTSRRGNLELALDNYTGPIKVYIYIGPLIPSDDTSVRDSVGFIQFGDFREQTEYGKVGAELNNRVVNEVLVNLDKENLEGRTLSFYGAFTIRTFNLVEIDLQKILIVPVSVDME